MRTDLVKNGTYDPKAPLPAASEGRPIGNKKAKAERAKEPMMERMHTAVEKCIADAAVTAAKKDEGSVLSTVSSHTSRRCFSTNSAVTRVNLSSSSTLPGARRS